MRINSRMLALIIVACLGLSGGSVEAASPDAKLKSAADDAYERILAIFKDVPSDNCDPVDPNEIQCNYWHLGNAFDTAIDYLIMNRPKAEAFAEAVIKKYDLTSKTPWVCWYDDYGWWAVAAQRALEQHGLWSKDQIRRFEEIAAETWTKMQTGLSVWDLDQQDFSSLKPYFDGGIWNYFWTTDSLPGVCQTPCDPTVRPLCGRQNTVTNGLNFVAASMRAGYTGDQYYLQAATRERDFLHNWFNFPGDISKSLLYPLDSPGDDDGPAVIRERVSTYFDGTEDFKFSSDLIWAGDQGLILGGLLRFIEAVPSDPDRQAMINLAERITDGVLEYLSDGARFFPWSNVKNPYVDPIGGPNIGGSPGGDDNDYNAGISVYIRYLLHAYQTNKEIRQHLQNTGYPVLVRKFAEDFAADDEGLCYPDENDCDDLVKNTNKLAALVAALEMK
jgi:hypothetical protein